MIAIKDLFCTYAIFNFEVSKQSRAVGLILIFAFHCNLFYNNGLNCSRATAIKIMHFDFLKVSNASTNRSKISFCIANDDDDYDFTRDINTFH